MENWRTIYAIVLAAQRVWVREHSQLQPYILYLRTSRPRNGLRYIQLPWYQPCSLCFFRISGNLLVIPYWQVDFLPMFVQLGSKTPLH